MLIGISGRMGSGKDTVGAYLVEHHGFTRYAFADQLKQLARKIGWNGEKDDRGRWLLQSLGQGAREVLGEMVWIDALERQLYLDTPGNVVITDVRNLNEADWIRRFGGVVWRIHRPIDRSGAADRHETEVGVDRLVANFEIANDGSLDDLYEKVEALYRRFTRRAA